MPNNIQNWNKAELSIRNGEHIVEGPLSPALCRRTFRQKDTFQHHSAKKKDTLTSLRSLTPL